MESMDASDATDANEASDVAVNNACADGDKVETEGAKNSSDPYFYTKRDEFTSEIHKIEISNLPRIFGHGQIQKLLQKLKLKAHKIKIVGKNKGFAFVSFRSEEDREKALEVLQGYVFKGCSLSVKKANPAADPLVQKRKLGEAEECSMEKRPCQEGSVSERIKEAVAAWCDVPYQEQLSQKLDAVKKVMVRYARQLEKNNPNFKSWIAAQRQTHGMGVCTVETVRPSPVTDGYRNKNEFSVGLHPETGLPTVGFRMSSYREGSMSVVEPDGLSNLPEAAKNVAKCFQEYVRQSSKKPFNPETHEGYWRQLTVRTTRKSHVMAIVVIHPQKMIHEEVATEKESLKCFFMEGQGKACGVTSLHLQRFDKKRSEDEQPHFECIAGTQEIEETVSGLTFRVSPDAFFQVNTSAAEILYDTAGEMAGLNSNTTLLDICCGTGTIALTLAGKAKRVFGIEVCKRAIENAKKNAEINGIENARFVLGKAEDVLQDVIYTARGSEDLVAVVDPPRQGLHNKVLRSLRGTEQLKKFVYISCNPAGALQNFVDLGRPTSNNYRGDPFVVTRAVPVDMFPHTPHCELVLLFERLPT